MILPALSTDECLNYVPFVSVIKHNAWTPCYDNPETYEWLFSQHRGAGRQWPEDP